MVPVSLTVRYRPPRIGWCTEADSLEHFSAAVALSNVFWGGRFNPIIPCADRELAEALIAAFRVDALYNVSGTATVDAFIKELPHIQWPEFHPELFVESFSKKQPTLLDVAHPAQHLFETHVDRREKPAIDAASYIMAMRWYGNALDFTHLVNFWNLRACDIDLFFYDPNSAARLRPFVEAYSALLHDRPKRSPSPREVT